MGGSSSRFDETDWDKADGKIKSRNETIDNASPTDSYGVYYLTKLGVSQRDYNVRDGESNLLYKTRAVEGTLACFDVLGNEQDDYRLRVQVDLSRRFWVVYHYGIPAFEGQMWDDGATEGQRGRGGWRKPLFRRVCITVTWSRYHAVVDRYRPAPEHQRNNDEQCNNENGNNNVAVESMLVRQTDDICVHKQSVSNAKSSSASKKLRRTSFGVDFGELCCSMEGVSDEDHLRSPSIPLNIPSTDSNDEQFNEHEKDVIESQSTDIFRSQEKTAGAQVDGSSTCGEEPGDMRTRSIVLDDGHPPLEQPNSFGASYHGSSQWRRRQWSLPPGQHTFQEIEKRE